jgi:hypothetical protein
MEVRRVTQPPPTLKAIVTDAQLAVVREWIDGGFRVPNCAERVALRAVLAAASPNPEIMREALSDALAGWRYIRQHHGDLYGVAWDRVEQKLTEALSSICKGEREGG